MRKAFRMLGTISVLCFATAGLRAQDHSIFHERLEKYIDQSELITFECRLESKHESFTERLIDDQVVSTASGETFQEMILFHGRRRTRTYFENFSSRQSRNARGEEYLRTATGHGRSLVFLIANGIPLRKPEQVYEWEDSLTRPVQTRSHWNHPFDAVTLSAGTYQSVECHPGTHRLASFGLLWEKDVGGKLNVLLRSPNSRVLILVQFRKSPDYLIESVSEYVREPKLLYLDEREYAPDSINKKSKYSETRTIWRDISGNDDWVPVEISMDLRMPDIHFFRHIRYVEWDLDPMDVAGLDDTNSKLSKDESSEFNWFSFRKKIELNADETK
jgi:hypothetical protein